MWSDWLVFCDCGFQSVCPLMEKDKRLVEASWWERLPEQENGSCSDGQGHVQQTFNPIFFWWVGLCYLHIVDLRPNYGGGNEDNGTSFNRSHACTAALSAPNPAAGHHWSTPPLETPGHPRGSLGQSLVGSLLLSLGSWCAQGFVCALQESVSPVLWKFCNQIPLASKVKFPGGSQSLCPIPRLGNLLRVLELS